MPTHRSMIAAGMDEKAIAQTRAKHICYVCGEPLDGFCQRDSPTPEAARRQVVLGDRHRTCEPSTDAGSSRKLYLGVG